MPRRNDIEKILILGSGPIVIGQAAEFDYSGVQACKVLREEGYEVVLVNSNPATIMTDPGLADATYIEPLLPGPVAKVIERERPDALLPTMGGQTALNVAMALVRSPFLASSHASSKSLRAAPSLAKCPSSSARRAGSTGASFRERRRTSRTTFAAIPRSQGPNGR